MPYTVKKNGNQYCVYKKTGEMVANTCHTSKKDAINQMIAIQNSEKMFLSKEDEAIARQYAEEIKDTEMDVILASQQYSYSIIARALIWAGRYDDALSLIPEIEKPLRKAYLYRMIGYYKKDIEMFYKARDIILTVEDAYARSYAWEDLIADMVDAGFLDEALEIAQSIKMYKTYVSFKEDAQGNMWFIGLYSNKFMDRHREILSEEAHLKYIDWVTKTGVKPQVILMHQPRHVPGFWSQVMLAYEKNYISTDVFNAVLEDFYKDYSIAQTEKLFYSNGFVGVVAKVYEDKKEWVNNLNKYPETLGMSHGFVPVKIDGNIYNEYRSFEFSVLPLKKAANLWTTVQIMEEKVMDQETQEFLDEIQDGTAKEIEEQTQSLETSLESAGVEYKEADVAAIVNTLAERMKFGEFVDTVADRFKELIEKVEEFDARLKAVEADEDAKIAAAVVPNYAQFLPSVAADKSITQEEQKQEEQVFDFIAKISGGKF